MSWAWNSVIGDEEEESQADDDDANNSQNSQKNAEKLILSVGIYLRTGSILIKSGRRPARALFGIYFDK